MNAIKHHWHSQLIWLFQAGHVQSIVNRVEGLSRRVLCQRVGAEDGTLPSYRSSLDAQQLAEERRVLYVGMTRAKRRLLVSWAENVSGWSKRCCRFLHDLPPDLVAWHPVRKEPVR